MKVATDIKTEDWNRIIDVLVKEGWKATSKYQGIDAGIDNDFLILVKKTEQIVLGWTNYFEGEIQCTDPLFDYLGKKFSITFMYGEPTALAPGYFLQREPMSIGKWFKSLFGKAT